MSFDSKVNYFINSLNPLINETYFFSEMSHSIEETKGLNSPEKAKRRTKIAARVLEHLVHVDETKQFKDLNFTLKYLDPVRDREVLETVESFLNQLEEKSEYIKREIKNSGSDKMIEQAFHQLEEFKKNVLNPIKRRTIELKKRIKQKDYSDSLLPLFSEVQSQDRIKTSASDMTMSLLDSKVLKEKSPSLSVSEINNKRDLKDLIKLLREAVFFEHVHQYEALKDQYGEQVDVSEQFLKDIRRSNEIWTINGRSYQIMTSSEDFERAALVKEFHRVFGPLGAKRLMSICHQGGFKGNILQNFMDVFHKVGWFRRRTPFYHQYFDRYGKSLPAGFELLIQPSPLRNCSYEFEFERGRVVVSYQGIWSLPVWKEDRFVQGPELVVKSTVSIPLDELISKDFESIDNPDLQLETKISHLIIDNPQLSDKLIQVI